MNDTKLLRYAELVLHPCSRVYGSSPCTAALGVTGDYKCYNSPRTCQDPANFLAGDEQIIRWAVPTNDLPLEIDCIPIISANGISRRPQMLDPGETMGVRESVTINFDNALFNDAGYDPYISDRTENPYLKGTYWGKFFARWGSLQGYEFRTVDGYLGQDINDMTRRYYIVDSTSGVDKKGSVSFTVKDAVKLLDGEKAQAPLPSSGRLLGALTLSGTSLTLTPTGIGNLEYPASGYASIGDEVVSFTRSGDAITLTGRGLFSSSQEEHDADDTFQLALIYDNKSFAYIINDILENYTELDTDYLDYDVWEEESVNYVGQTYDGKIMKPTPVKTLINELIREVGLVFWTDLVNKKIKIKALRAFVPTIDIDDNVVISGSMNSKRLDDKRVSDVWVYYGKKNPLEAQDKKQNYKSIYVKASENAIVALEQNTRAISEVTSRWIKTSNQSAAEYIANSIIYRYETAPRQISFRVPPSIELIEGQAINISSRIFEDAQGDPEPAFACQVIGLARENGYYSVVAEELKLNQLPAPDVRVISISADTYDIDLRALHDSLYSPAGAGDIVRLVIDEGIYIGSTSPETPALDIGIWPDTVILQLGGTGTIEGHGGIPVAGADGGDGGIALYTREAVEIIGDIKIKGGGGAGGGAIVVMGSFSIYEKGGAGAGFNAISPATKDLYQSGLGVPGGSTGRGGSTGEDGQNSSTVGVGLGVSNFFGGTAGLAIDGYSYLTISSSPTIVGDTAN